MHLRKLLKKRSFLYTIYFFLAVLCAVTAFFMFSGLTIITVNLSSPSSGGSLLVIAKDTISGERFVPNQFPRKLRFFVFADNLKRLRFELRNVEDAQINYISYLRGNPLVKYVVRGRKLDQAFTLQKQGMTLNGSALTGNVNFSFASPEVFSRRLCFPGAAAVSAVGIICLLILLADALTVKRVNRTLLRYRPVLAGVLLLTTLFFIFHFASGNVTDYNLWFDESGQFWIARGLNHFSPKYAEPGGLSEVIENNIRYNLDPGGYSVLLHYLTQISTDVWFMRSASYAFFVLGMVIISCLVWKWVPKCPLVWISGGLLFFITHFYLAVEIRAYSMEIAVTLLVIYVVSSPEILKNWKTSLLFGILLAIGMTSRYSAILTVAIGGTLIFVQAFFTRFQPDRNKITVRNIGHFLCFCVPQGISVLLIYFMTLRHQNSSMGIPPHLQAFMLNRKNMEALFLNWELFGLVLPFLLLSIFYICGMRKYPFIRKYGGYIAFTLLLNAVIMTMSLLGKSPWAPFHRSGIAIQITFLLAFPALASMIWEYMTQKAFKLNFCVKTVFLCCVIVMIGVAACKVALGYHIFDGVVQNRLFARKDVLIDVTAYPTIRYGCEYGVLRQYRKFYDDCRVIGVCAPEHLHYNKRGFNAAAYSFFAESFPLIKTGKYSILVGHGHAGKLQNVMAVNPNYRMLWSRNGFSVLSPADLIPFPQFKTEFFHKGNASNALALDCEENFRQEGLKIADKITRPDGSGMVVAGELLTDYADSQFVLKAEGNGVLSILLRGENIPDRNRLKIKRQVDYSSLKVNGRELLPEAADVKPVSLAYNQSRRVEFPVRNGEALKVELRCRITLEKQR